MLPFPFFISLSLICKTNSYMSFHPSLNFGHGSFPSFIIYSLQLPTRFVLLIFVQVEPFHLINVIIHSLSHSVHFTVAGLVFSIQIIP